MSDYTSIRYELSGGVAHITFCRPDVHNALDLAQVQDLEDVTAKAAADPEVRCILLDAEGKSFHVGGNLKYFADVEDMPASLRTLTAYAHSAAERLSRGPAPVVIAIQGMAAGAGMSIATMGDIVVAGESAAFTMAYTAGALTPDMSSTWHLAKLVGLRRAQELIFTNRRLSAHEAMEWGLITEVVADEILADHAREVAEKLAAGPTQAFAGVKKLLRSSWYQPLEAQLGDESEWIARMGATEDTKAGIQAFLAKEKPTFTGR